MAEAYLMANWTTNSTVTKATRTAKREKLDKEARQSKPRERPDEYPNRFGYSLALNYVRRALTTRGVEVRPALVHVNGMPTPSYQDDGPEYDIAQDAFLRYHYSRVGTTKDGKPLTPLTTRQATRYAVREYFIRAGLYDWYVVNPDGTRVGPYTSRRAAKKNQSEEQELLAVFRHAESPRERKLFPDLARDLAPTARVRMILSWLSSGATVTQTAEYLGISQQRVSAILAKLREGMGKEDIATHTTTQETRPGTTLVVLPYPVVRTYRHATEHFRHDGADNAWCGPYAGHATHGVAREQAFVPFPPHAAFRLARTRGRVGPVRVRPVFTRPAVETRPDVQPQTSSERKWFLTRAELEALSIKLHCPQLG